LLGLWFCSNAIAATPLVQISPTLYYTEHCFFVIDASVPWASPSAAYDDLYTYPFPKLNNAYDALIAQFPGTYFSICYIANTGYSSVPNYIDRTAKASGINESSAVGPPNTFATTDMCRYNQSGGAVSKSLLRPGQACLRPPSETPTMGRSAALCARSGASTAGRRRRWPCR